MAEGQDIITERLKIVPFTTDYLTDEYVGWLNDKQLMRYSEQRHLTHSRESCLSYLGSFRGTSNFFWAIVRKSDAVHIGNINAYVNGANKIADLGIILGAEGAQGEGYGTEAWGGVCNFLFAVAGIRKITAGTMAENIAMLRLMGKVGMKEDGIRRRHYLLDDQEIDVIHMALFKDMWQKG